MKNRDDQLKVLALNPFHGGSHRAFLDGWISGSLHEWTVLSLPDCHWKWRMRHAAITFADEIRNKAIRPDDVDLIFATDMLNLAELKGLLPGEFRKIPTLLYFHENQLTYPNQESRERDLHFGMTNIVSALAADAVWFNSNYHHKVFLQAVDEFCQLMPTGLPTGIIDEIELKSAVLSPGIESRDFKAETKANGPFQIVWAARWEHDKNPDDFFTALTLLQECGVDFRVSVIGQSYNQQPDCFDVAKKQFADQIIRWGFIESREAYWQLLHKADAFVSTANHEFFGIAAIEAISAGCVPVLPNRLSYPEIVQHRKEYLYDGSVGALADQLEHLIELRNRQPENWQRLQSEARCLVERFQWNGVHANMDKALINISRKTPSATND